MRRPRLYSLCGAALLASLAVQAQAQDKPGEQNDERSALFNKLDANSDGVVAADEVPAEQKLLFTRLLRSDRNQDGKLSLEEFLVGTAEEPRRGGERGEGPRREGGGDRPSGAPAGLFEQLDANKDGKVTVDEVPEDRRERFAQMVERADKDGDKSLSRDEFAQAFGGAPQRPGEPGRPGDPNRPGEPGRGNPPIGFGGPADALLRLLDTDKDGKISADELAKSNEALKGLDRNSDGQIDREELMFALRPMLAGGPDGARRPEGAPQGNPDGRPDGERFLQYLKQLDKNNDGKWSKDELPERMQENFARLDANSDGVVDETELKQMFAQMQGRRDGAPGAPRERDPDAKPRERDPDAKPRVPNPDAKPREPKSE